MPQDITAMLNFLRTAGGDTMDIEVKSAAGGLPESLTPTLSALANLPGGGKIVLGLDERVNFAPVHLSNLQTLKQGLATKARAYLPPVRLTIDDAKVGESTIVVAQVHECDSSAKPCRVSASGRAYLRSYDGDFELSPIEEQGFLAARRPPHFDRLPVDGATVDDLDTELIGAFVAAVRERDPRGLGRFRNDSELLRRAGVTIDGGQPTVAGLLALGVHPQEFFPRYVIQASAEPRADDPPGVRARNQMTITGAIPRMLDEAMNWARKTFDTSIVTQVDGTVRDQPAYPLVAFREMIANALVHRDLDHWSAGLAIEVRLRSDRLVVANPGGLYGITVNRLGHEGVTSARNARLVAICQHVRTPDSHGRVIEALASGIPTINASVAEQGLPAARFLDAGIRFTALLHQSPRGGPSRSDLTDTQTQVYEALTSVSDIRSLGQELGIAGPTIRKALRFLRERGLVTQEGGPGRTTKYRRI